MEHCYGYWLRFGTRSGCQNFRASFHQASNQNSTGFGLKNFFRAPRARSAGKPMEHSYRYRLRFGGPIWLPKLPSTFPRVFENFQATDRSMSHACRYRFPKIATGNRTIVVSLSMFCAGHRWYMCRHRLHKGGVHGRRREAVEGGTAGAPPPVRHSPWGHRGPHCPHRPAGHWPSWPSVGQWTPPTCGRRMPRRGHARLVRRPEGTGHRRHWGPSPPCYPGGPRHPQGPPLPVLHVPVALPCAPSPGRAPQFSPWWPGGPALW